MRILAIVVALALSLTGCNTSSPSHSTVKGLIYAGPSTTFQEESLAKQTVSVEKTPSKVIASIDVQEVMATSVFKTLKANGKEVCAEVFRSRKNCEWIEIGFKDTSHVNAYAWGHDTINVNRALLSYVEDRDQMAFVISHDMAHLLAKHVKENSAAALQGAVTDGTVNRMAHGALFVVLFGVESLKKLPPDNRVYGEGYANLSEYSDNSFDDNQEREADYISSYLMATGGFDLIRGRRFLVRMAALNPKTGKKGKQDAALFDIHSFHADRIARLTRSETEILNKKKSGSTLLPSGRKVPVYDN